MTQLEWAALISGAALFGAVYLPVLSYLCSRAAVMGRLQGEAAYFAHLYRELKRKEGKT